eukprot:5066444-Pleurochrysis_carterae.AAC.2
MGSKTALAAFASARVTMDLAIMTTISADVNTISSVEFMRVSTYVTILSAPVVLLVTVLLGVGGGGRADERRELRLRIGGEALERGHVRRGAQSKVQLAHAVARESE